MMLVFEPATGRWLRFYDGSIRKCGTDFIDLRRAISATAMVPIIPAVFPHSFAAF